MSTFKSAIELSKIFKISFFYCVSKVSIYTSIVNLRFNLPKNVTQLAMSKVQGSSHM